MRSLTQSCRRTPCDVDFILEDVMELGLVFLALASIFQSHNSVRRYSPKKTSERELQKYHWFNFKWILGGERAGGGARKFFSAPMTKFVRKLMAIEANFDVLSSANALRWGHDISGRHRAWCYLSCAFFIFSIGSFFLEILAEENAKDLSPSGCLVRLRIRLDPRRSTCRRRRIAHVKV